MKWLVIQSNGEHTPNKHLRECWALKHAIEACWHECDVWGLRHDNFATIPDFESYDIILCAEQYENAWLPDFSAIKKPLKLHWIVDLHCQAPEGYKRISEGCHIILHATRRLMDGYMPNKKNIWFPNAVDDRYFTYFGSWKSSDIGFVGNINPERRHWIERFQAEFAFKSFTRIGQEMIDLIRGMRIHWNINGQDINYRTFETIGCGSCLLTNHDEDLARLGFIDGVNCLTYRNFEEARDKASASLTNGSWLGIASRGYELSKRHTYTQRIHELLRFL